MRITNRPTLSRQQQKLTIQLAAFIGKSHVRSLGSKSQDKVKSNVNYIACNMAKMGYQNASDFKLKTYRTIMTTAKNEGASKSVLESLHGTMRTLANAMGKHSMDRDGNKVDMIPRSSTDPKAMNSDEFHRGTADRVNPQFWAGNSPNSRIGTEMRDERQAKLQALNPNHASAAKMAREFGLRKEESLASRELLVKTADGKYMTTAGVKEAGRFREVNERQIRYAFTENKKDACFERDYLSKMVPGREYIVVEGSWAKLGKARLVPVLNDQARIAAISHQAIIRKNQALAKELGVKNVNSVIAPDMTRKQGYDAYTRDLAEAGFKREGAASLHADRSEFCQRMRAEKDEDGNQKYTDQERTEAMGHGDTDKLAAYGG